MVETDRAAVHEDQVDLRMGHAQRLDGVLDRRRAAERAGEGGLAPGRRQEIIQLLIEAEFRRVCDWGMAITGRATLPLRPAQDPAPYP